MPLTSETRKQLRAQRGPVWNNEGTVSNQWAARRQEQAGRNADLRDAWDTQRIIREKFGVDLNA